MPLNRDAMSKQNAAHKTSLLITLVIPHPYSTGWPLRPALVISKGPPIGKGGEEDFQIKFSSEYPLERGLFTGKERILTEDVGQGKVEIIVSCCGLLLINFFQGLPWRTSLTRSSIASRTLRNTGFRSSRFTSACAGSGKLQWTVIQVWPKAGQLSRAMGYAIYCLRISKALYYRTHKVGSYAEQDNL